MVIECPRDMKLEESRCKICCCPLCLVLRLDTSPIDVIDGACDSFARYQTCTLFEPARRSCAP
jgi:hypothetical protein